MQFSHAESRNLQNCCLTCHFQINVISKRIKLATWDCAQMKALSSSYRLVISYDLLHGYLGRQIWKTMGCVFFFNSRNICLSYYDETCGTEKFKILSMAVDIFFFALLVTVQHFAPTIWIFCLMVPGALRLTSLIQSCPSLTFPYLSKRCCWFCDAHSTKTLRFIWWHFWCKLGSGPKGGNVLVIWGGYPCGLAGFIWDLAQW